MHQIKLFIKLNLHKILNKTYLPIILSVKKKPVDI